MQQISCWECMKYNYIFSWGMTHTYSLRKKEREVGMICKCSTILRFYLNELFLGHPMEAFT